MTSDLKPKDCDNQKKRGEPSTRPHREELGFVPPDGGWGWVVCIASLWVNGLVFGILNSYGIIYVPMLKIYGTNDPNISFKTSWVGSVTIGMTFLMSIFASILADRIGIRKVGCFGALLSTVGLLSSAFVTKLELLYLTYGILIGVGGAFIYSPSLVILGHYFKKKMGLVNGLVSFGSALFSVSFSQILPVLIERVQLKNTLLILSGLEATMVFCALTWKPVLVKETAMSQLTLSSESIYEHVHDCCSWTKKYLNVDIWKNKGYVIWALSCGISLFGYFVPFVHLIKHTQDLFSVEKAPFILMSIHITSGISRLVFGKLADHPNISRIRLQQMAFFGFGTVTMLIPFLPSFYWLIGACLCMGIFDGIFICLLGPIAFDIVGPSKASQAIGFLLGLFSVPLMCGPPVAGFLYDKMRNYNIAFHIAGTTPILGSLIMFFIPKITQQSDRLPNLEIQANTLPAVTQVDEFAAVSLTDMRAPQENRPVKSSNVDVIIVKPQDYREPMLINHDLELKEIQTEQHESPEDQLLNNKEKSEKEANSIHS
ncbi:monocarboxylate transporter 10-like [Octopus vulgaris]|uniref:Monocarboxylate transporter 10-like n=2 Tax=Octopus TaxID=6643 RepID=A0AA36FFY2_OCTVU|nr:monocarboxylate transporter 10 isoform X1 [Octopus sinensis]CAI9737045.1 monocarboxylate transporter 10-like [Octopus vulgaris]